MLVHMYCFRIVEQVEVPSNLREYLHFRREWEAILKLEKVSSQLMVILSRPVAWFLVLGSVWVLGSFSLASPL